LLILDGICNCACPAGKEASQAHTSIHFRQKESAHLFYVPNAKDTVPNGITRLPRIDLKIPIQLLLELINFLVLSSYFSTRLAQIKDDDGMKFNYKAVLLISVFLVQFSVRCCGVNVEYKNISCSLANSY
jgi:hypothetical protein